MGFLRSISDLQKQAKEIDKDFHPGQQMKDAKIRMAAANEMMAEQTKAAQAAVSGIDGMATVLAVRQTGAMINFNPSVEIDLTVLPAGRPPYPATVRQTVPQIHLARLQPGAALHVKIDPGDAQSVWIDYTAV
jgi:hypothetical protein